MLHLIVAVALAQDYYPLGEGYTWTYEITKGGEKKEFVKKVSGKEKVGDRECFVVEDQGMGGEFKMLYLAVEKDAVWVHRMRSEIEKPFQWLKLPLKKGDTWSDVLTKRGGEGSNDTATMEFVTEDEEEVTVTAGKYKTWRVKMIGKEGDDKDKGVEVAMWFAADVGEIKRIVKLTSGDKVEEATAQLVKFDKGK